jgi:bifunctional non-homologous end joining protein LigD
VDKLQVYRDKRDPARTPEPVPADAPPVGSGPADGHDGGTFVIQEHHARRLHWDFRLERDGVLVSWALPKGVPADPAVNHLAVHTEDHPLEYASFEGEIPKGEYGAGAVTRWDHGRYETLKWAPDEVKVRLHGRRVTGGFALFQTRGNQWMIHRERQSLPTGMRPMLALTGAAPRDRQNWALEMKWDGVRALAYIERGRVRLASRTERDITVAYPELAGLGSATPHKQLLLDGEIVVFGDEGWPRFEALQPRMHVSSASAAAQLASQTPVTYLVFDLLQLDGVALSTPTAARCSRTWASPDRTGRRRPGFPARTSTPCSPSRSITAWRASSPSALIRSTCPGPGPITGARSRTSGARRPSWPGTSRGRVTGPARSDRC